MVSVVFGPLGEPLPRRTRLLGPTRVAMVIGAFLVALGLVGMHTLFSGHHASAGPLVPAGAHTPTNDVHGHATESLLTDAATLTVPCHDLCEPDGAVALCLAILAGLVLLRLRGRSGKTRGARSCVKALRSARPATVIRAGPSLLTLLCVRRT